MPNSCMLLRIRDRRTFSVHLPHIFSPIRELWRFRITTFFLSFASSFYFVYPPSFLRPLLLLLFFFRVLAYPFFSSTFPVFVVRPIVSWSPVCNCGLAMPRRGAALSCGGVASAAAPPVGKKAVGAGGAGGAVAPRRGVVARRPVGIMLWRVGAAVVLRVVPAVLLDHVRQFDDEFALLVLLAGLERMFLKQTPPQKKNINKLVDTETN